MIGSLPLSCRPGLSWSTAKRCWDGWRHSDQSKRCQGVSPRAAKDVAPGVERRPRPARGSGGIGPRAPGASGWRRTVAILSEANPALVGQDAWSRAQAEFIRRKRNVFRHSSLSAPAQCPFGHIFSFATAYAAGKLDASRPEPPKQLKARIKSSGGSIAWLGAQPLYQSLFHKAYCRVLAGRWNSVRAAAFHRVGIERRCLRGRRDAALRVL